MCTPLHRVAIIGGRHLCRRRARRLRCQRRHDSGDRRRQRQRRWRRPIIALLLPESKTTRYEAFDKPLFEAKVAELCSDCDVDYYNADQDEAKQQQQVATAIYQGRDVIVLDPVNGDGAGGMVADAQAEGTQVIAYDRFIEGADYYMSFDNNTVGKMQGEALVEAMGGRGDILMLNGAPERPERRGSSRPVPTACSTAAA